jgi:hypothetical protein
VTSSEIKIGRFSSGWVDLLLHWLQEAVGASLDHWDWDSMGHVHWDRLHNGVWHLSVDGVWHGSLYWHWDGLLNWDWVWSWHMDRVRSVNWDGYGPCYRVWDGSLHWDGNRLRNRNHETVLHDDILCDDLRMRGWVDGLPGSTDAVKSVGVKSVSGRPGVKSVSGRPGVESVSGGISGQWGKSKSKSVSGTGPGTGIGSGPGSDWVSEGGIGDQSFIGNSAVAKSTEGDSAVGQSTEGDSTGAEATSVQGVQSTGVPGVQSTGVPFGSDIFTIDTALSLRIQWLIFGERADDAQQEN